MTIRTWRIVAALTLAAALGVGVAGFGFISVPGVIPASGCATGAVFSTDEFTSTGFSQVRTVGPNAEATAGNWVIADDAVPSTGVLGSPNCPIGGDTHPLFVVALKLTPTIGSWQSADVQQLQFVQDTNLNGQYDPGQDLVLQSRSGSELAASGGATFFNGPQAPLTVVPDGGSFGLLVVIQIGPNPTAGSQFGLMLEGLAADVPGNAPPTNISSGFSNSRNPAGSSIRLQIVGGQGNGGSPPGGGGSGSSIAQELGPYDQNGNDRLEDPEFLNTIDDWVDRQLSDAAFFAAIDVWIGQSRISSASVDRPRVQTRRTSQGVRFSAPEAARLSVEVFNLEGRTVFRETTYGATLNWNLRTDRGTPLANGVYLYRTTTTTSDGETVRGEVRKLVVRR